MVKTIHNNFKTHVDYLEAGKSGCFNIKSCDKKFIVPDSAVTATGRLVQCSSCGNKWTQYPLKAKPRPVSSVSTPVKAKPKKKVDERKTDQVKIGCNANIRSFAKYFCLSLG